MRRVIPPLCLLSGKNIRLLQVAPYTGPEGTEVLQEPEAFAKSFV